MNCHIQIFLRESTPDLCINFLAYCMDIKVFGNKKREKKPLKTGKLFSQILGCCPLEFHLFFMGRYEVKGILETASFHSGQV